MSSSLPDDAPRPRLCHLRKWADFNGYGFNLHAERGKAGQYIGSVDQCSPSQAGGLQIGDRIVEVNGVNIGNENHQQVVQRIKAVAGETKLLVIDHDGDQYYQDKKILITGDLSNIEYLETPLQNPYTELDYGDNDNSESHEQEVKSHGSVATPTSSTSSSSSEMISQNSSQLPVTSSTSDTQSVRPPAGSSGMEFPTSVKEAREKMSKKRNVKAPNMTAKDKYDLLQKL